MSNSRLLGPSCLACSFTEQCNSCARRHQPAKSSGRGGRLQFVVVDGKREHSNMHFGLKPRLADLPFDERKLPVISGGECENAIESANSIFRTYFAGLGYQNEQLIAVTDSSLIFRAGTPWFQGAVSIKLFRQELLETRFGQKIFSHESAMVAEMNHPNIAALYDFGIACNGTPYLVNHFVPGWSLRELNMQGVQIEPISLFMQLCEGLAFAHSQKIVHGRLSSSKIISTPVRPDVFVSKIIDFAVSAALRAQLPFDLESLRSSASPEERFGQDPDFRSDIFSLGHIMYETLSGSKPMFNRDNKVIRFTCLRGVPQVLEPLVVRCLSHEPKDRYESANELLADLRMVETRLY